MPLTTIDLPPEIIVSFLSLFIPAMIGIFGSFSLYLIRKQRRGHRLRIAIRSEISSLSELDHPPENAIPVSNFRIPTSVYQSAGANLGLLTDDEVNVISSYYCRAEIVNALLEREDYQIQFNIEDARNRSLEELFEEISIQSQSHPLTPRMKTLIEIRRSALDRLNERISEDKDIGLAEIWKRAL